MSRIQAFLSLPLKRFLYLLFVFFIPSLAYSQDRYLDSLKLELDKGVSEKSEIDILLILANAYQDEYPDSLANLVERLRPLVDTYGDPLLQAKSQYYQASNLKSQGESQAALTVYRSILEAFKTLGDSLFYMKTNRGMGLLYYNLAQLDSAEIYFKEGLQVSKQIQSKYFEARNHRSLAHIYIRQDQYFQAIDHCHEGINLAQELKDTLLWADNLSSLANVHFYLDEFGKMAEYTRQSLELMILIEHKPANFNEYLLSDYLNLGITFILDEKIDQAGPFLMKGDSLRRLIGKPIPNLDNTLGHFYLKTGQEDSARFYLQKTLKYGRSSNDAYVLATVLNGFGELYLSNGNYDSAALFLEENLTITQSTGQAFYYSEALLSLSEVEAARKNYQQAYDYYKTYHELSDSLLNEGKIKEITTLENRYIFESEKRQLAQQQKEKELLLQSEIRQNKTIQNGLILGLIFVFIIAAIIFRFYQTKTKDNLRIKKQQEQLRNVNDDLVQLSNYKQGLTQMIAHDMKNPLNVIISLASNYRKKEDLQEVVQSGQLMLNMIHNMLDIQRFEETKMQLKRGHFLMKELILKSKYQVELLLMAKSIEFINRIDDQAVIYGDYDLITRVLINLYTNAIKYTPIGGKLTMEAQEVNGRLKISIADTGQGISASLQEHIFDKFWQSDPKKYGMTTSNGLGLTFCKMAVMAHGGQIAVLSKEQEGSTFYFDLEIGDYDLVEKYAIPEEHVGLSELTSKDQELIKRISDRLRQIPIYKSSKIEELLKELDPYDTPGIGSWKNKVREASYSFDNQAFEELINV